MPKNLEVKILVETIDGLNDRVRLLGAEYVGEIQQKDTYFTVAHGRLKLREMNDSKSELIYYDRDETLGARWSEYQVFPVDDVRVLKTVLSKAMKIKVVVEKRRQVFLYKTARIHLDQVTGLGHFLELEVMERDRSQEAHELLDFLLEKLSLKNVEKIRPSYSDLLLRSGTHKK